jgi:hypothetical protein
VLNRAVGQMKLFEKKRGVLAFETVGEEARDGT